VRFGCSQRDTAEHLLAHIYEGTYAPAVPGRLAVLDVIAEPTRRRILDAVRGGERSVGELVGEVLLQGLAMALRTPLQLCVHVVGQVTHQQVRHACSMQAPGDRGNSRLSGGLDRHQISSLVCGWSSGKRRPGSGSTCTTSNAGAGAGRHS
jgi:hypothetical protein